MCVSVFDDARNGGNRADLPRDLRSAPALISTVCDDNRNRKTRVPWHKDVRIGEWGGWGGLQPVLNILLVILHVGRRIWGVGRGSRDN